MNWSFGIITSGGNDAFVRRIIQSIERQFIPNYEILVVGGNTIFRGAYHIPFDESKKSGWISRKKNIIAQQARYDNLCILHDYVELHDGWYDGWLRFGEDWLSANNVVLNLRDGRYRCWDVIANDSWHDFGDGRKPFFFGDGRMLRYDLEVTDDIARWIYYNGACFCTKRQVLLDVPLNEERCHGQGEDVLWCRDLYFKYGSKAFRFNPFSTVQFLKYKDPVPWQGLPML